MHIGFRTWSGDLPGLMIAAPLPVYSKCRILEAVGF